MLIGFTIYVLRLLWTINVVVDEFNDSTSIFREDDIECLIDDAKNQLQKMTVTPHVATETNSNSTTKLGHAMNSATKKVTENLDITNPTNRYPPTRIQKDHLIENIIGDVANGIKMRDKPKRNYFDMVRYVVILPQLNLKMSKKLC